MMRHLDRRRLTSDEAERLGLAALPLLEARQDHAGLAEVWYALAIGAYNVRGRCEQIVHAAEMARTRTKTLAGRPHHRSDALCGDGAPATARVRSARRWSVLDALDSSTLGST